MLCVVLEYDNYSCAVDNDDINLHVSLKGPREVVMVNHHNDKIVILYIMFRYAFN